jgi:transposase
MRGRVDRQASMFVAYNVEDRIPDDHPLRRVKAWADSILQDMRRDFDAAYAKIGRPGIPPEQLLKALLLRALYSIPSERRLMEAIEFNLLYRWFVDLPPDVPSWAVKVFCMNRDRFMAHDLVRKFFDRVVIEAMKRDLVSNDHFTVDGTLVRSWASHKSIKPITPAPGNGGGSDLSDDDETQSGGGGGRDIPADWRGKPRSNATHRSTTDPEARLARKGHGKEAHLCHSAHVVMENRNGLCLDIAVDSADGQAERREALRMLRRVERRHGLRPQTLGADAGYDDGGFLVELESRDIEPHVPTRRGAIVAQDANAQARRRARRRSRTKRHKVSQRVRKRVEQVIGWCKTVGGLARTRFIGHPLIEMDARITGAAYNLLRMAKLAET